MSNRIVIIGVGAHARKILRYAEILGLSVQAFIDDNPQAISLSSSIPCLSAHEANCFKEGQRFVVGIGNADARRRLHREFEEKGWQPMSLIHPGAYVAADAMIGAGSVICAQAVVETGSVIGAGSIVDVGSIVDHDCVVGTFCHLRIGSLLQAYTVVTDGKIVSGFS
jgi:sugar O-acyltransferase (sialic acid O-acetyltransferase NeuD family)